MHILVSVYTYSFKVATYWAYAVHILTEALFALNGPGKTAKLLDKLKFQKLECSKVRS